MAARSALDTLHHVFAASALAAGDEYFACLCRTLGEVFDARMTLVAELASPMAGEVRTRAVWRDGTVVPNLTYPLAGTPCAQPFAGTPCYVPTGVAEQFPGDPMLAEFGISTYLGVPVFGAAGQPIGIIVVLGTRPFDHVEEPAAVLELIAFRARAEFELGRDRDLMAAVLQTAATAVCVLSPGGEIVFANDRAEQILGLSASQVIGRRYDAPEWHATAPDGGPWPEEAQPFTRVLRTGEPVFGVEHAIMWPDGRRKLLSVNGAPIKNAAGQIVSLVFSVSDVTEQREIERRFWHAQKLEAVGRLAGGIAHDFNNVLTAILGYVALLRLDLPPDEQVLGSLDGIDECARRASALTRQLLAFARRQPVTPRIIDANAAVRDLARMLARLLGDDVELALDLGEPPCDVLIDPGQFEQVLANLAVNARDAMPGGGRLTIATRTVADDRRATWLELSVTDTGEGIPEEVRHLVFDPFFTTKAPGRGTGLGLATCHGIVSAAGGTITFESARGHGTAFRIRLPRAAAPAAAPESVPAVPPSVRIDATVLLVEDEPLVRSLAASALARAGAVVHAAAAPAEAVSLAARLGDAVDLLVTDIVMPEVDGITLADSLRAARPRLAVLLTSGYAEAFGPASGAGLPYPLLAKPYTPDELATKARDVLEARRSSEPPQLPLP
jgi:PAS domain S-box-containing protein